MSGICTCHLNLELVEAIVPVAAAWLANTCAEDHSEQCMVFTKYLMLEGTLYRSHY